MPVTEESPAGRLARGGVREAQVQPLDLSGIPAMIVGIVSWAVAFFVLLFFRDDLDRTGRDWWLWVTVTGFGLGFIGLWYCRRRWAAIQRSRSEDQASSDGSSSS